MIDGRRRRGEPPTVRSRPSFGLDGVVRQFSRLGTTLVKHGVTADEVTVVGILFAIATSVVIGLGYLYIGIVVLTIGGLMDALDGVVAKAAGAASLRGAFFDSVADRISDAFIFGGVAWYLLERSDPRAAILPVAILAVSSVISYTRAKAESLGLSARGGLMERAERLIFLGLALLLHVVMVPLLGVLLALTTATAIGRFRKVWLQASAEALQPAAQVIVEAPVTLPAVVRTTTRLHRSPRIPAGDLQPLAMRLRGVLRTSEESPTPRSRRSTQRRERRSRTSLRRPQTDY
ncbi:MAG TPA: CDP-alcohol phosphatidyltransferase family protein [Acidimicrobiales bacterium]